MPEHIPFRALNVKRGELINTGIALPDGRFILIAGQHGMRSYSSEDALRQHWPDAEVRWLPEQINSTLNVMSDHPLQPEAERDVFYHEASEHIRRLDARIVSHLGRLYYQEHAALIDALADPRFERLRALLTERAVQLGHIPGWKEAAERRMTTAPHLGGHFGITNTDEATLDYLIARFGIRSMLDVGCGPGGMIEAAKQRGLAAWGVDGDYSQESPDIFIFDYTTGPYDPGGPFDLIWCVEFVEHVTERYIPNFLATFRAGRVLFLTHALPGQGGHHHVNEQPPDYWAALLENDGWTEDTATTAWVREHAGNQYTKATGCVWTR